MRVVSGHVLKGAVSAIALGMAMVPVASYAQDNDVDTADAEEEDSGGNFNVIIVTAQKRAENLNDVPVAVTAFSGEALDALAVNDANDLIALTPGLESNQQSGSNRNVFLRGIGTGDFHLTAAPAVGQYYDDVTLTSGFQARAALYDIERVEVLKGPQNTLFGLNTTGGAINYISRKPEVGAGPTGSAKFTYGNDDQIGFEGALGLDNGTNIAARLAVYYNSFDGPFVSTENGVDYGDEEIFAGRFQFLIDPGDDTTLSFTIHGSTSDSNGPAGPALGTRDPNSANPNNPTGLCPEFGNFLLDFSVRTSCLSRNGGANGARPVNPSRDGFEVVAQTLGDERIDTIGGNIKFVHDFDFAELTVQAAYDNLSFNVAYDGDGGPTTLLHLFQEDDRDTLQYEARLVSSAANRFRWIAGIFYLDQESDSYTGAISPGIGGGLTVPNVQLFHTRENLAVYGQAEYDLLDNLTFTAGARWSDEELVGDYLPSSPNARAFLDQPIYSDIVNQLVLEQFANATGRDARGFENARKVQQVLANKDVGYTFKLDWKPDDDHLLYAIHSKGFKGGALDIRAAYATLPAANVSQGLFELAPESLKSYELGYKGSFWDGRINLDVAAFYYDYRNLQQFTNINGLPALENAPKSEVYGVDGNLRFSDDNGLYIDLGFALLESEVTDAGTSSFVAGVPLGRTPSYKLSAIATKEFTLANGNELRFTGSVSHTDEQLTLTLTNNTDQGDLVQSEPAITLVNASMSYSFGGDNQYKFTLWGNNLTDENYCGGRQINATNNVLDPAGSVGGLNAVAVCRTSREATRTYGASVSVNW